MHFPGRNREKMSNNRCHCTFRDDDSASLNSVYVLSSSKPFKSLHRAMLPLEVLTKNQTISKESQNW